MLENWQNKALLQDANIIEKQATQIKELREALERITNAGKVASKETASDKAFLLKLLDETVGIARSALNKE